MKKITLLLTLVFGISSTLLAQTNPALSSWLLNTTGIQGRHYVNGNSTPINDNIDANVQLVQYSTNWVYINATGIPAYITGPFLDGNPSLASDQDAIYRFTLNPSQNTGSPSPTTGGNIGNFINGVSLFDYRDGVAWNPNTNALCGGPGNPACPGGPLGNQDWNRDAVPSEMDGFDCAKAHPANGNYHHHQNPSAFNLDLVELSTICDLYVADGLYAIDSTEHSPLIGFAYDGFPIYGAYAYANTDGTGAITRMKSAYELSTATTRVNGPNVNATYFRGYFREDYQFISSSNEDVLDEHNGRFCITPEYPNGIYCYFATVDENWNSAYPYVVGPTFYGNVTSGKVTSINEAVTTFVPDTTTTPVTPADTSVFSDTLILMDTIIIGDTVITIDTFIFIDTIIITDTTFRDTTVVFDTLIIRDTTITDPTTGLNNWLSNNNKITILPNPANDWMAVQISALAKENVKVSLLDIKGKLIKETLIYQGSTISYIDTRTIYSGTYFVFIQGSGFNSVEKLLIKR